MVIVGFGRAGKIHKKAYDALAGRCNMAAVVEPNADTRAEIESALPGVKVFRELGEALGEVGSEVIVDFCVPAKINLDLVGTALTHGIRKFLIEKPLGWDSASSKALVAKLSHCQVVYMDTYVASRGIQKLLEKINQQGSAPIQIDVLFHKDRVPDSTSSRGFVHDAVPNAWMIEGPHMLSIARKIAGEIKHILDAHTFDMQIGKGQILPEHGGGYALLEHANGALTHLDLSLCSGSNERRVDVQLGNGVRISVELPPSKAIEQVSMVTVLYPSGRREEVHMEDRPMEFCVQNAIRFLAGEKVTVCNLSDGLAVSEMVKKMTNKSQFWQNAPKQWKYFGPPLRPCPEDIKVMEKHVSRWFDQSPAETCNVLLCGVTPEIAEMCWPPGTRLWAVEKSRVMIEEIWPARKSGTKQAVQAEWLRLPFQPESFDIVIGDGCFTSLEYPRLQSVFLQAVRRVMRGTGLLIMRFFVQPGQPEQPKQVFADLAEGKTGSFHAFKWRLAMSMQTSAREGVRVGEIWKTWNEAKATTSWPAETVDTINTYRNSDHRLTFTNLDEIRELHSGLFQEQAYEVPGYELGDRCPIMVFSPR